MTPTRVASEFVGLQTRSSPRGGVMAALGVLARHLIGVYLKSSLYRGEAETQTPGTP